MKETNVGQSLRGTFTAWTCIMYHIEDSGYIDTYSVATDIIGDDHGEVSSKMEKIQRMATSDSDLDPDSGMIRWLDSFIFDTLCR